MLKVPTQTTKRCSQIPDQRIRQESALQFPRTFPEYSNRIVTSDDTDDLSEEKMFWDNAESIQSPASTEYTSISNLICIKMVNSQFYNTKNQQFLPKDVLAEVFDEQLWRKHGDRSLHLVIAEAMQAAPSAEVDSLVQFILAHAKVVFLIAIHTRPAKLHQIMLLFQRKGFTDMMLPVKEIPPGSLQPEKHRFMQMQQDLQSKVWEWSEIQDFQRNQWKFLAPCITTEEADHEFGNHILPFEWVGKDRAPGGQSFVYQYRIHKAHFYDSSRPVTPHSHTFAVKNFRRDTSAFTVALKWRSETQAMARMNALKQDGIVRFITAFSHGIGPNLEHFVVFEWASGGNLRDLWKYFPDKHKTLKGTFVKEAMFQLKGLADALCAAHYLRDDQNVLSGASYRHGDLKPENILWFRNSGEFGTLKIGDWGEAKSHTQVTAIRPHDTDAGRATVRYEPPEVHTGIQFNASEGLRNVRSRLFDLWGFGCIALEMVVWFMYGYDGLVKFNSCAKGTYGLFETFWELDRTNQAVVHGAVNHWMDHMANEPRCRVNRSALGNLLQTIRRGLLVVKLPSDGGLWSSSVQASRPTGTQDPVVLITAEKANVQVTIEEPLDEQDPDELRRYRAFELADELTFILSADDTASYWNQPCPQTRPPDYLGYSSLNTVVSQNVVGHLVPAGVTSFTRGGIDYQHPKLKPADWTLLVDNHFAGRFVEDNTLAISSSAFPKVTPGQLCYKCRSFRSLYYCASFKMPYEMEHIESQVKDKRCYLCCFLWPICNNGPLGLFPSVTFERMGSALTLGAGEAPTISLFRNCSVDDENCDIQIGFPELPIAGENLHIQLLRQWVKHCDHTHKCNGTHRMPKDSLNEPSLTQRSTTSMPTRLIDVGTGDDAFVYLRNMKVEDEGEWIALSYRWGGLGSFSTTHSTIRLREEGMEVQKLPATFRDAVKITRALDRRYLWIDSLCILQGADGDFDQEAARMEDVYSGAYCVIAATRATDQDSGFLRPRIKREYVSLPMDSENDGILYLCRSIDNFNEHVLKSDHSRRGWVLQEHALARRSIFFTEYQTYWQCGHGVRCETMTNMTNEAAALLGDPKFPKILLKASQGERIVRTQELFQQYSRLELTADYDRPAAIAGLQQRLRTAMKVQGAYGVFKDPEKQGFFCRSLLWTRGPEVGCLSSINFPGHRRGVPTWSWMAVTGGIDYFRPPFNGCSWTDIRSQSRDSKRSLDHDVIAAVAHEPRMRLARNGEDHIRFDDPLDPERERAKVVVLGIRDEPDELEDRVHYVLVVALESEVRLSVPLYRRIGAGHLPGRCLGNNIGNILIV